MKHHQGGDDSDGPAHEWLRAHERLPTSGTSGNGDRVVRELVLPEDVRIALDLYPDVRKVWESSSEDTRAVWLRYIEEAENKGHREQRIDIMISGLRP